MAEIQLQLDLTDVDGVMDILLRQADLLIKCREAFESIDKSDEYGLMYQAIIDLDDYFKEYE